MPQLSSYSPVNTSTTMAEESTPDTQTHKAKYFINIAAQMDPFQKDVSYLGKGER